MYTYNNYKLGTHRTASTLFDDVLFYKKKGYNKIDNNKKQVYRKLNIILHIVSNVYINTNWIVLGSLLHSVRLHLALLVLLVVGLLQLSLELPVHLRVVVAQLLLHQIVPARQLVAVLERAVANILCRKKFMIVISSASTCNALVLYSLG